MVANTPKTKSAAPIAKKSVNACFDSGSIPNGVKKNVPMKANPMNAKLAEISTNATGAKPMPRGNHQKDRPVSCKRLTIAEKVGIIVAKKYRNNIDPTTSGETFVNMSPTTKTMIWPSANHQKSGRDVRPRKTM